MGYSEQILYQVAHMYYIDDLSQAEISSRLSLSRSKVSRLLARAKEQGIVQVSLSQTPSNVVCELEELLKDKFGLKNILIVPSVSQSEQDNLRTVVADGARFFQSLIKDGDKIGVSWGYTLLEISKALQVSPFPHSSIVQIAGNLDNADATNYAGEIIRRFGEKMCIDNKTTMPCPIIVESPIIVDLLLHDSKISSIIKQINAIDVAFVDIGTLSEDGCLGRSGFVSLKELLYLQDKKSVGSVCSRFIDAEGEIVDDTFNNRTLSINLPILRDVRISCACIASESKVPALCGAIKGGLVNTVAVDSNTAGRILQYLRMQGTL